MMILTRAIRVFPFSSDFWKWKLDREISTGKVPTVVKVVMSRDGR